MIVAKHPFHLLYDIDEHLHIPSVDDIQKINNNFESIEKAFLKNESLALGKQLNYL